MIHKKGIYLQLLIEQAQDIESSGKSIHKTSKVTLYFCIILCKYCQTTLKKSITDVRLNEEIFGGQVGVWQNFQRPEVLFKFFYYNRDSHHLITWL